MNHVFRVQPKTMVDLKNLVNEFSQSIYRDLIRKVCGSARDRFEMLEKVQGGHFENQMSKLKKEMAAEE